MVNGVYLTGIESMVDNRTRPTGQSCMPMTVVNKRLGGISLLMKSAM